MPKNHAPAILYTDAVILKAMLAKLEAGEQPEGMLAVTAPHEGTVPLFCSEEVARLLDKQIETVAKFLETYTVMDTSSPTAMKRSPGANYAAAIREGLHLKEILPKALN